MIQSNLKQDDVKIGDQVRMWIPPGAADPGGFVEGTVAEMASSGGVVGIQIGGVWFSSGLRSVLRVEPAEYARIGDWLVQRVDACTCAAAHEPYHMHEPGCGWEPVVELSKVPELGVAP